MPAKGDIPKPRVNLWQYNSVGYLLPPREIYVILTVAPFYGTPSHAWGQPQKEHLQNCVCKKQISMARRSNRTGNGCYLLTGLCSLYSIVNSPFPCVDDRRSVEYPNICRTQQERDVDVLQFLRHSYRFFPHRCSLNIVNIRSMSIGKHPTKTSVVFMLTHDFDRKIAHLTI